MCRYKLITFDITGTILKFSHPPGLHYAKAGALYGVKNIKPEALTSSFKKQWKFLTYEKPNFGLQHGGWENWWTEAVQGTFIDAGAECDRGQLESIAKHLIGAYTTSLCWQHCDGAIDLLDELKSKGIPLGVISNFDARLESILENMKVKHYFDFIVTSYGAGHSKPDPRIFQEALRRVQDPRSVVDTSRLLHVGDTRELDSAGALQAGWNSWLVAESHGASTPQEPHIQRAHFSGSLSQLKDHLNK